jgi:hypothetical protein
MAEQSRMNPMNYINIYKRYADQADGMASVASGQGEYELANLLWQFEQKMLARAVMHRIEQANALIRGDRPAIASEVEEYRRHGLLTRPQYEHFRALATYEDGSLSTP